MDRVFWKPRDTKVSDKNDTSATSLRIVGLKENTPYELVIKSGNYDGTSKLTDPVFFTLSDKYIISASTRRGNYTSNSYCQRYECSALFGRVSRVLHHDSHGLMHHKLST